MKKDQISMNVANHRYFMKHQTQNNTLYVTNFSRQLGRKVFESLFLQFGKINQICLFNSIKIAVPYGFVQYDDLRDAVTAKNQLQNKIINGLPLKIQYKKPKISRNQPRNQYFNNNQLPYYNEYPKFSPINTQQNNPFLINPTSANKKQNQLNQSTTTNLSYLNEDNKKYQVKKQLNLQNKYVIPVQQIKIQPTKIQQKYQWTKLSQKCIISDKNQINQNNNNGQKKQMNQLKIVENNEQKKPQQIQKQTKVIQQQKQPQKAIEILMGSQNKNNINEGTKPQPFINKYYKTERQRDRIKHSNRKSKSRNSQLSSSSNSSAQNSSQTYKNYRRESQYKRQRHRQKDRLTQRSKQTDKQKRQHIQSKHQHTRSRDKNRLLNIPKRQNYYVSHRQNQQKNYQRYPENQQDKYRMQTNLKYCQQKRLNNIEYNYQNNHHPKLSRNLYENSQFYKTPGSSIFQTIPLQTLQPNYWQLKSHISRLYRIIQSLVNRVSDLQQCIEENSHAKKEHNIKLI